MRRPSLSWTNGGDLVIYIPCGSQLFIVWEIPT
jgi:hypothetical protein